MELLVEHDPENGGDAKKYNQVKEAFLSISEKEERTRSFEEQRKINDAIKAENERMKTYQTPKPRPPKKTHQYANQPPKEPHTIKSIDDIIYYTILLGLAFLVLVFFGMIGKTIFDEIFYWIYEDLIQSRFRPKIPYLISSRKVRFNKSALVGDGISSNVYRGVFKPHPFSSQKVIIKIASNPFLVEMEQVDQEIELLKKIGYHENIVCMIGYTEIEKKPAILMEVLDQNLSTFLQHRDLYKASIDYKKFYKILRDISQGKT